MAQEILKEYQKAITEYDKAVELDPEYAEAYYRRGVARIQQEPDSLNFDGFIDLAHAILLNPDFEDADVARQTLKGVFGADYMENVHEVAKISGRTLPSSSTNHKQQALYSRSSQEQPVQGNSEPPKKMLTLKQLVIITPLEDTVRDRIIAELPRLSEEMREKLEKDCWEMVEMQTQMKAEELMTYPNYRNNPDSIVMTILGEYIVHIMANDQDEPVQPH
jgi:tetratricopeptide (TPR) repeat protein